MLYKLLRQFLAPYRRDLTIIVALQLVAVIAMLYLPRLNADIIDNGLVKGDIPYIWKVGGLMLAMSALQVVCSMIGVYLGGRAAMGAGRDIRGALLHRANNFSAQEIGTFGAPSLITRNTNDVTQVQILVVMACTALVMAPMMCIGGIFMALHEDVGLSWVLLVAIPVLAFTMSLILVRLVPLNRSLQRRVDNVNRVLREQISGVRVIRAFVREKVEADRFEVANDELTETSLRVGRLMALMFPSVMFIGNVTSVAVIWFGGIRIDAGRDADRFPDRDDQLRHADHHVGDDGFLRRDDGAASRGQCRANRRGPGHRIVACHSRRHPSRFAAIPEPSSSAESRSATQGPNSQCCSHLNSRFGRERPPRSSVRPAPASRRW